VGEAEVKLFLDTHVLVWLVSNPDKLSKAALGAITRAQKKGERLYVSSVSIWEIAMLIVAKRLVLTIDTQKWLETLESLPSFSFVPVGNAIAKASVFLDDFPHRDPADRMIVASARDLEATLVTSDQKIRAYKGVKTIW